MWKDNQKKKRNFLARFIFSPLFFTLVLLVVLAAIVIPLYKNMLKRYNIDGEILELRNEIAKLETGNQDLKKILSYLESDQFAETEARLNFGLKKKGEEVVVVQEEAGEKGGLAGLSGEDDENLSNPRKWLNYFFKNN